MEELRTLLHALADRLAVGLDSRPSPAMPLDPEGIDAETRRRAVLEALQCIADGDLSLASVSRLHGTPEGERLNTVLGRLRELVASARSSVAAGTDQMSEVRAAAERAAEGASRQRVSLEKTLEQLRHVAQRSAELSNTAGEIGDLSERAALLALNTGIEGLRAGGEIARALSSLGEELRKISQRCASGAHDLGAGLRVLGDQTRASVVALEEARGAARVAGEEATRAATLAEGARRAETTLASSLRGFRTLDDETEALVAQLATSAARVAKDVAAARARLDKAEPLARSAIESALEALERAAATETAPVNRTDPTRGT